MDNPSWDPLHLTVHCPAGIDASVRMLCVRLTDVEAYEPELGRDDSPLPASSATRHQVRLIVEVAVTTWRDRPEHDWLKLAGYDFFGRRCLLYRQADWPKPALNLDVQRVASARRSGVANCWLVSQRLSVRGSVYVLAVSFRSGRSRKGFTTKRLGSGSRTARCR